MILQYKPGREFGKKPKPPVVIHSAASTPAVERSAPTYDPLAAYQLTPPISPKRKRGRPPKVR